MMRRLGQAVTAAVLMLILSGCAGTRVAQFGPIDNGENLLTLLVTEDRTVVERECPGIQQVVGCFASHFVPGPDGATVKAVKIVRYTESLPSPVSFEIDAHELCHAIAALQNIPDPCHAGNHGLVQAPFAGQHQGVAWR